MFFYIIIEIFFCSKNFTILKNSLRYLTYSHFTFCHFTLMSLSTLKDYHIVITHWSKKQLPLCIETTIVKYLTFVKLYERSYEGCIINWYSKKLVETSVKASQNVTCMPKETVKKIS